MSVELGWSTRIVVIGEIVVNRNVVLAGCK